MQVFYKELESLQSDIQCKSCATNMLVLIKKNVKTLTKNIANLKKF